MTISVRLDDRLTRRLASLAKARGISKSEPIRKCLRDYLAEPENEPTAWELGKHLFGCYKSGQGDMSARAKEVARARIHARHTKQIIVDSGLSSPCSIPTTPTIVALWNLSANRAPS